MAKLQQERGKETERLGSDTEYFEAVQVSVCMENARWLAKYGVWHTSNLE